MASIHRDNRTKIPSWRVSYTDANGHNTSRGGFRTKREAEIFRATVQVNKLQGVYVSPSAALVSVADLAEPWLTHHRVTVKPSTFYVDESAWRVHVLPEWGGRGVGSIRRQQVASWVASLAANRSATIVARAHGVLSAILDSAVEDNRLVKNPARGVKLPRKTPKPRAYLTIPQVELLASVSEQPVLVLLLAYTGLRFGEAIALRVKNVRFDLGRIQVSENAVRVGREIVLGTPKTHENRSVPYPPFMVEHLTKQCLHKKPEQLVFTTAHPDREAYLSQGNSYNGWFARAVRDAKEQDVTFPRVTPHDLRHTAASLAISAGANVKIVQRMLGHASAAMTLDRYADLFPDDLDSVAKALTQLREQKLTQKS